MPNDRIIIRDLLVRGILGVNPEERVREQDILLNLVIYTDLTRAAVTRDLSASIDYAAVAERVAHHVAEGQDLLAETLAHDLARIVVTEFGAPRVMVRVEKPAAVPAARAAGVEIERTTADFAGTAPLSPVPTP